MGTKKEIIMKIKYFKPNVNKNITNQNIWDAAKTVHRWQCTALKCTMLGKTTDENELSFFFFLFS